jgi:hypothetical protein
MASHPGSFTQTHQSLPSRTEFFVYTIVLSPSEDQNLPEDDRSCPICGDTYQTGHLPEPAIRLDCGHLIGVNCAVAWFEGVDGTRHYRNTCPYCRSELYRREMAPIGREEDVEWYDSLIDNSDEEDLPHLLWLGHPEFTESGLYEYHIQGQPVRQEDNDIIAALSGGFTLGPRVIEWIVHDLVIDRFPFLHLAEDNEYRPDDDSGSEGAYDSEEDREMDEDE